MKRYFYIFLLLLLSTGSTPEEEEIYVDYGNFPYNGPIVKKEEHKNWCVYACLSMLANRSMCDIVNTYNSVFLDNNNNYVNCCSSDYFVYNECNQGVPFPNIPDLGREIGIAMWDYWIEMPVAVSSLSPSELPKMAIFDPKDALTYHAVVVYFVRRKFDKNGTCVENLICYIDPEDGGNRTISGGNNFI